MEKKRTVFVFIYEEKTHLSARAIELCVFGSKWEFFCKTCLSLRLDNDWMDEGHIPASSAYPKGVIGSL